MFKKNMHELNELKKLIENDDRAMLDAEIADQELSMISADLK
ncbi:hypothetical protein PO185_07460 [Limosilactobacillus mucosae]|uniref:Uncharacterized protein n=1 Tax=Limosilactobacillus mucosae TaxID=97478 RepID=A0AAJ1M8J6_LIMMU|nr:MULTISPECIES: hypothetical protein [Lactobacillaceae]MDD6454331.1 hypothetical protein [Lactobacillus sp.]MDC2829332.1 hypothetical protein [Limosilactobacillus mucosae]MDC2837015.1 hypothetical protein [Limosilactobacillus mucosae]MDC2839010.1 hypothetical protein [Limosilactobacillus mucosae]MDC2841441.1 hypothetical protein [Limosilactobacillus mucosae]